MRNFLRLLRVQLNREKKLRNVYVELCSKCNLRCKFCAMNHAREANFLSPELFEKFCKDLIAGGYSVANFVLALSGESLLHPEFIRILTILERYKDAINIENVVLTTNAVLLDTEMAVQLVYSGVLNLIQCSVDGYDAVSFEKLRRPAKFDVVKENILTLCAINTNAGNPLTIMINNGNMRLEDYYSLDFVELSDAVDYMNSYEFHGWGREWILLPANRFCRYAFKNVTVFADGRIGKCCYDLTGMTAYGDLNTHSIGEILTSKRRKRDLLKMFWGKRKHIEGCAGCTVEK